MLVAVFYWLLMFLVYYILLERFKLGDEVLYMLRVDKKNSGFRSDGDLILDNFHKFSVGILRRHAELLC